MQDIKPYDQQIENIVDEIVDIVLTDADVHEVDTSDGSGRRYHDFELNVDPKQRDKLVNVFERLLT